MCKKKYINKYNTATKKEEKEEKTRTWINVCLSADINSCLTNCTFSKINLHEGQQTVLKDIF